MRKLLVILAFSLTGTAYTGVANAQDHTRNWENGNVVSVTHVHLEDGMFNAYINDLNNVWRKFMEAQMDDGDIVAYNMYSNVAARKDEPDLILTITFKNWAVFDRSNEYFEEMTAELMGSTDNARTANIDRGELRTIGSTFNLQEIKFKD